MSGGKVSVISSGKLNSGVSIDRGNSYKDGVYKDGVYVQEGERSSAVEQWCCSKWWVDFTQNTTLHGLKYIWLPGALHIRRLLWLLLTLTCVAIMSFQVIDRIIYFYDWPVTVNVKVNFNKTLSFPTITLCNQNAFRASAAAELGYYDLLTYLYTGSRTKDDLDSFNASSLTFRDIHTLTAHTKEDLIVSCRWRDEECGWDNFTEVMTDHGLCYTFNTPHNNSHDLLSVISPGAENGLSLTLNVEQYEYMPGPHDAAGVKILIHDHKQFPKVQELGIALPTGSHSFVGLQLITVDNLPKPHGECLSPSLHFFQEYSLESCEVDCFTRYLADTCGCRLYYMPYTQDSPDVCTLQQYYDCYHQGADYIRQKVRQTCPCPVPCSFHIFDPTVSYATTSIFVIDRFLSNTNRSALKMKYDYARDITHRFQRNKLELFASLTSNFQSRLETLKSMILEDLWQSIKDQTEALDKVSANFLWNWKWTDIYFRYQNFILKKNLIRARDAMNERTFSILAHGVQAFTFSIETNIKELVDPNITDDSVRETLFLLTKNQLNGRLDIARRTRQNYTQLIGAFLNATSIFNYSFMGLPRNESDLVLPQGLLEKAFTRSDSVRDRSLRVEKDIIEMAYWMKEYGRIAKGAYYNNTLNATDMYVVNVLFLRACREFLQSKSMFFNDFIQWPGDRLDERETEFQKIRDDFIRIRESTYNYLSSVSESIDNVKTSLTIDMMKGIRISQDFLNFGNISKLAVAKYFRSKEIQNGANRLSAFFDTVRSRGQDIYDSWDMLSLTTKQLWNFTLAQKDLMRYWNYRNLTRYLRNYTEVAEQIAEEYEEYRDMIHLRSNFLNKDEEFVQSLKSLMEHMEEFYSSSHVDSAFVRDNFLKVDVFYRELSYEKITQQKAYDMFALLCDIGGSMGLFIGASVMTIFEILDLIMHRAWTLRYK